MIINRKSKFINLLIFIIILALFLNLTTKDWYTNINPILAEYNRLKGIYENMSLNLKMKDSLLKKNNELKIEISKLKLDTDILQEEIMSMLYILSKKNNIEIEKITFSEAASMTNLNVEEEITDVNTIDTVVFIQVNMNFKCNFNDLLKFIDNIKDEKRYVAISYLLLLSWNEKVVYGVVDFYFYTIPMNNRW